MGLVSIDAAHQVVKERYEALLARGDVARFDQKMIPFVKYLNTLEGVATAWCCEGHLDNLRWRDAYVLMAVTVKGMEKINVLHRRLYGLIRQREDFPITALRTAQVIRCLPVKGPDLEYNAITIGVDFPTEEHKIWFYEELYKMLGIQA